MSWSALAEYGTCRIDEVDEHVERRDALVTHVPMHLLILPRFRRSFPVSRAKMSHTLKERCTLRVKAITTSKHTSLPVVIFFNFSKEQT
jgi:hypothetical protein